MITIPHEQFRKAALFAGLVLERRTTIPVLSTIKVSANGALVFEGTDLDTYTRAELPYDGEPGEFLITEPAKLVKAMKRGGGETVAFRGDGKTLHVSSGELTADLATLPADDHPGIERIASEQFGATLGSEFFRALNRVRPAISTEETRYYLNGVFIHKIGDWLYRLAATDGHRLFIADVPLPDAAGDLPDAILPRRFIERAVMAFAKSKDGVRFRIGLCAASNRDDKTLDPPSTGNPRASFSGDAGGMVIELTSKLIDGTYPDYRRVIPTQHEFTIRAPKAEIAKAIASLIPLSTDKTRAIKITALPGQLRFELNSPDVGKSRFTIQAGHRAPEGFEIGFNARYLLDALAAYSGDEIEIQLTDSGSPAVVLDPADTGFKVVLMPMRV